MMKMKKVRNKETRKNDVHVKMFLMEGSNNISRTSGTGEMDHYEMLVDNS